MYTMIIFFFPRHSCRFAKLNSSVSSTTRQPATSGMEDPLGVASPPSDTSYTFSAPPSIRMRLSGQLAVSVGFRFLQRHSGGESASTIVSRCSEPDFRAGDIDTLPAAPVCRESGDQEAESEPARRPGFGTTMDALAADGRRCSRRADLSNSKDDAAASASCRKKRQPWVPAQSSLHGDSAISSAPSGLPAEPSLDSAQKASAFSSFQRLGLSRSAGSLRTNGQKRTVIMSRSDRTASSSAASTAKVSTAWSSSRATRVRIGVSSCGATAASFFPRTE